MAFAKRVAGPLAALETAAMAGAGALLVVMTLVATTDAALRYAVNAPLTWSYDLISLYLLTGVFYLGLSNTLRVDGHISVDILHNRMSARMRHASLVGGYALALFAFAIMTRAVAERAIEAYSNDEAIVGSLLWPTWIAGAMVTLGLGLTGLRLAHRTIGHLLSALAGHDVIALPPLAGRNGDL